MWTWLAFLAALLTLNEQVKGEVIPIGQSYVQFSVCEGLHSGTKVGTSSCESFASGTSFIDTAFPYFETLSFSTACNKNPNDLFVYTGNQCSGSPFNSNSYECFWNKTYSVEVNCTNGVPTYQTYSFPNNQCTGTPDAGSFKTLSDNVCYELPTKLYSEGPYVIQSIQCMNTTTIAAFINSGNCVPTTSNGVQYLSSGTCFSSSNGEDGDFSIDCVNAPTSSPSFTPTLSPKTSK